MFEGKNIHFSPLDNKPLCSFSSKLCRQRRLNGYAFCIRHILEDKSAPFKQCDFVTRNNSQKCLNAIPSNKERGYCHSHMQKVVGTVPNKVETITKTVFPCGGTNINNNNNTKSAVLLSSSSIVKNSFNLNASLVRDDKKDTAGDSSTSQQGISSNNNGQKFQKAYENNSFTSSTSSVLSSASLSNNKFKNNNNVIISSSTTTTTSTTTLTKSSINTNNSKNTTFQKGKSSTFNITSSSSTHFNNHAPGSGFKTIVSDFPNATVLISEKIPVNNNNNNNINNNKNTYSNINTISNSPANLQTAPTTANSIATIKCKVEPETPNKFPVVKKEARERSKKVKNIIVTTYIDNNKHVTNITPGSIKKKPLLYAKYAPISKNTSNNNNNSKDTLHQQNGGTERGKHFSANNNTTGTNVSAQNIDNNSNTTTTTTTTTTSTPSVATLLCVRDRWKKFKFNKKYGDEDIKPALQLEQMKTIKILEKLPLFAEVGSKSDDKADVKLQNEAGNKSVRHAFSSLPISSGIEILLVPPFLSKTKLYANNIQSNNNTSNKNNSGGNTKQENGDGHLKPIKTENEQKEDGEESSRSSIENESNTKIKIEDRNNESSKTLQREDNLLQPWEWETRKEFLARVRRAFKRQYKTITKASKLSEKQDKNDKAFRTALVTCALNDSSRCAQILVSDPRFEEETVTEEIGIKIENQNDVQLVNNNNNGVSNTISSFSQFSNEKNQVKKLLNGKILPAVKTNCIRLNNGFDDDSICDPAMTIRNDISNTKSTSSSNKLSNLASGNYLWPNGGGGNLPDVSKKFKTNKKLSKCNRQDVNGNQFSIKSYANPNQTLNGINNNSSMKTEKNTSSGNSVSSPKKKIKKTSTSPTSFKSSFKKRKVDSERSELATDLDFSHQPSGQLGSNMVLDSRHDENLLRNSHEQLLGAPSSSTTSSVDHLQTVSNLETVLNSVSSSEAATTPDSFGSPFDHSTSSQPDVEFSDDDLENSFELQIDPEIAHQASRLLEDNGLTEDDFNDLFPETRMGDHKGRSDLGDLGIDFTSNFDATDIHYDSLFANIFPSFSRTNLGQPESISVNHQF